MNIAAPQMTMNTARTSATRVVMLVENCSYPRDIRVRREAEALTNAGLEVTVICPALEGQPREEVLKGVRIYRYAAPPEVSGQLGYFVEYGYSLAVTFVLALRVAVRHGIDVIHAANPPDLFVFLAAFFKPFGVRFIYDQHDLAPEMYRARYAGGRKRLLDLALRVCERCSYWLADHVVVANASYRENAIQRGKVPPERVSIVRNGPDAAQLDHCATAIAGLGEPGVTVFAYLGLMGTQDGVAHLIGALNHLRHDLGRTDFLCLLVGSGEEQPNLERLTRTLGLEGYVRFTGFIPDPAYIPYLLAADICVDPDPYSEYNDRSTMIKVLDYMALAKPIVAFDLSETRRSAGNAAVYVSPNDEMEFAKALAALMDDPERRGAMGAIGRRRVEGELSWSSSAACLLRAYAALSRGRVQAASLGVASGAEQSK
jgi:glycosyltransferase involved in cell wall biosynthesis